MVAGFGLACVAVVAFSLLGKAPTPTITDTFARMRQLAVFIASSRGRGLTFPRVKLSVKSDYAARAVLGLSRHYASGMALKVEDLASEFNIPANFLVQILIGLKAKHLVKSIRGKVGGYLLAKPPAEISLGDVLRAIHGEVFDTPALADAECPPELLSAWRTLQAALNDTANRVTFQQLLEATAEREKMYYI